MIWPKISIVTCSYNQGRFLEETINSVLDQNYPNLEYIIIDGGSTDNSVEIIKRYSDRLAFWISEPDRGQTHALKKGFARSKGDIQGWLCSDDILEYGTLKEVGIFFLRHPEVQVVYGDFSLIDIRGNVVKVKRRIGFNRWIWLHDYNYIPQPSTFWRKELYEKVGGLDESFDIVMDADLWQRFSKVSKIYHVPHLWSRARQYDSAKSWNMGERCRKEILRIVSRDMKKPTHRFGYGVKKWSAGIIRAISEQTLSMMHWLVGSTKKQGLNDNPFKGFRLGCKRWFAHISSFKRQSKDRSSP